MSGSPLSSASGDNWSRMYRQSSAFDCRTMMRSTPPPMGSTRLVLSTSPSLHVVARTVTSGFPVGPNYDLSPDGKTFVMLNPLNRVGGVQVVVNWGGAGPRHVDRANTVSDAAVPLSTAVAEATLSSASLGRGHTAIVSLAANIKDDRKVAMRRLPPEVAPR
jgi:hypothetical protein